MKRTALNLKDFPSAFLPRCEVEGTGNSRPRAKLQSTGSFVLLLSFLNYVFKGEGGGEGGGERLQRMYLCIRLSPLPSLTPLGEDA